MEFRLLGPLEAWDGDAPVGLGPHKQQALLARLLLDAGRVVAVERLVDDLWGEAAPETAVKMVPVYVSRLPEGGPIGAPKRTAASRLSRWEGTPRSPASWSRSSPATRGASACAGSR